ncbi:MAG: hypothetical protein ABEI99_10875, partial [Halobaculum sp.]
GLQTTFVDSLYWFWEWEEPAAVAATLREKSPDAVSFEEYDPHHRKLVGHVLADRSYLQWYPDSERTDLDPGAVGTVTEVNPVIDDRYTDDDRRDRVVVSLCGQLSPAVSESQAVQYAQQVVELLEPALRSASESGYGVVVTGNERVTSQLSVPFPVSALGHDEMLRTVGRAAVLLCPPSITSVYEATLSDVPVVFLPEQHAGHWENYRRLAAVSDEAFDGFLIGTSESAADVYDGSSLNEDDGEAAARRIQEYVGETPVGRLRSELGGRISLSEYLGDRGKRLGRRQRRALFGNGEVPSGAHRIAADHLGARLRITND